MENENKKIIFFLHLNDNTMEKGAIPIFNNDITKEMKYPTLLCKIRNKIYKSIYIMYLIDFPITEQNKDTYLFLQVNKNLRYPFEINFNLDYFKKKNPYYFYFEKIIFKERIKNNFFDNFFRKNKDLEPPFSCDINIFEQSQLILGYINSQKRKEQFELLYSLKEQIGFGKFSRLAEMFLMYLKIIFVDNYNTKLIQELLTNYKYINFDVKPSFNFSLFFDSVIKPIFIKPYIERNFFVYNNFEYDLRNCLNSEYNRIFDKLCLKYYIYYDKEFLMNENNLKSRIKTNSQKYQIYELLFEMLHELKLIGYCNYLIENNFLSKKFIQDLVNIKQEEINDIKKRGIIEFNINNFTGLKIYQIENYKIPFYCLGKLNNNYWVRSIDDKELYIYDDVLNAKIRVNYNFSKNTKSLFQMSDGNLIIVYSNNMKICIIEVKSIYNKINQIYSLSIKNDNDLNEEDEENYDYILKVIETHNKNIIVLSKKIVSFYYNKSLLNSKEKENLTLYDYIKYSDIKQKDNLNNFSILEFNYNFIIYISGNFEDMILNRCFITLVNINYNKNKNIFESEYSKNEIFGVVLYPSVFEDNNILFKLSNDIMGICGSDIYLYTLKYKEIFQIIEIPSHNYIDIDFCRKTASSFFMAKNEIIYIAVKYFNKYTNFEDFEIKIFLYCFLENKQLKNIKELVFLSEAKPSSQEGFYCSFEIQN